MLALNRDGNAAPGQGKVHTIHHSWDLFQARTKPVHDVWRKKQNLKLCCGPVKLLWAKSKGPNTLGLWDHVRALLVRAMLRVEPKSWLPALQRLREVPDLDLHVKAPPKHSADKEHPNLSVLLTWPLQLSHFSLPTSCVHPLRALDSRSFQKSVLLGGRLPQLQQPSGALGDCPYHKKEPGLVFMTFEITDTRKGFWEHKAAVHMWPGPGEGTYC